MLTHEKWQHVAALLCEFRNQQQADWHGVTGTIVSRYLLGTSTAQERAGVEQARQSSPKVARCLAMLEPLIRP